MIHSEEQGISRRGFLAAAATGMAAVAASGIVGVAPALAASGSSSASGSASNSNSNSTSGAASSSASASASASSSAASDSSAAASGSSAAAAPVSAAAAAAGSTAPVPQNWDGTYDVIVCGGGGSGLTAAFSALENGAQKVLVIEKGSVCGGTTAMAEGAIQAAGTPWQKELTDSQDDTPDKLFNYWMTDAEGLVEEDLVRTMADNAADNLQWMADNFSITFPRVDGVPPVPYLPKEYMAYRMHIMADATDDTKTGGSVWTNNALAAIQQKGGEIMTDTEAASLIVDGENGVVGVATGDGKNYKADHGVCLCMSGIEHNEELAKRYNPQHYWELKTGSVISIGTDTGDGILMGLAAGADIGRVGGTVSLVSATGNGAHLSDPEMPAIYVNMQGFRFVREDTQYAYQARSCFNEAMKMGGWDGYNWEVMDNKMTQMTAQCPWSDAIDGGADKRAEDLESGILIQADTIEELEAAMGIPTGNLTFSVDKWNSDMDNGVDTQFGREKQLVALDEAPFFAYRIQHTNVGSLGALKINTDAAILDRAGNPIPHLFGGGQNTSGWVGPYYPGSGTSLQGTLNWGRIAGRSAANA